MLITEWVDETKYRIKNKLTSFQRQHILLIAVNIKYRNQTVRLTSARSLRCILCHESIDSHFESTVMNGNCLYSVPYAINYLWQK